MKRRSFQEIVDITTALIKRFEEIEQKEWGIDGSMIELMKQVGQLSSLVMMQEKYYSKDRDLDDPKYQTSKEKIADELSDLLFMVIRIADLYQIDLEDAHLKALESAENFLRLKGR